MELTLMNYKYIKCTPVEIGSLEDIASIIISIMSGDEIALIKYKDGSEKKIDSADLAGDTRLVDSYDGSYVLYDADKGVNKFDIFGNRRETFDIVF